jgi:hypothetical protein
MIREVRPEEDAYFGVGELDIEHSTALMINRKLNLELVEMVISVYMLMTTILSSN